MIVVCSNCAAEDRPGFVTENPPYRDDRVSHGICQVHAERYRAEIEPALRLLGARHKKGTRAPGEDARHVRPLPRSFSTWLDLSSPEEAIALLVMVQEALERKGYVCAVATRKMPHTDEPASATQR